MGNAGEKAGRQGSAVGFDDHGIGRYGQFRTDGLDAAVTDQYVGPLQGGLRTHGVDCCVVDEQSLRMKIERDQQPGGRQQLAQHDPSRAPHGSTPGC